MLAITMLLSKRITIGLSLMMPESLLLEQICLKISAMAVAG